MGSPWFETPNIDRLSKQGMVFTNAYAGASNCAPSRASLMTGLATPRHGIYTVSPSARGDKRTRRLIPVTNTKFINDDQPTIGDLFKRNGYVTGTFGKWHIGADPTKQGFDLNIGGGKNGNPGKGGYFSPYNIPNIEDGPEGEYLPDRLTDEAINFLKLNKDNRFYAHLPYYTVHTPLMGKQHLVEKYLSKPNILSKKQAIYAAMVEALDHNIGRLIKALEDFDLDKNTVVIFTSDNGGIAAISPQTPLRAGKGSYFEGGIRVPLIVKWPGITKSGTTNSSPTVNLDFFPTFSEMLENTHSEDIDGTSLGPLLNGKDPVNRSLIWHFPIYLEEYDGVKDQSLDPLFRTRPGSVIRSGNWKLHHYYEKDEVFLYNLKDDPGETTDLSSKYPELTESLFLELEAWLSETNAPLPSEVNLEYDESFELSRIQELLTKDTTTNSIQ